MDIAESTRLGQEAALRRLMIRDATIFAARTEAMREIQARVPPPKYFDQEHRPSLSVFEVEHSIRIGE